MIGPASMSTMKVAPILLASVLLVGPACGYHGEWIGSVAAEGGAGGASGTAGGAGGAGGSAPSTRDFLLGADISWVQEEEDAGVTFVDTDGTEDDILAILRRHGLNAIRLRLFHDPSTPCRISASGDETCGYQFEFGTRAEPYCDLDHTIEMAQRVKAAGLRFLLDIHYSDTWADPDDQNEPLAWETLGFDELTVALEEYTRDSLLAFQAAGALPDLVQLGNEITPGMLFPDGRNTAPGDFDRFATLLKAAVGGVRAVDGDIEVILHIEKPDNLATSDWWVSNVLAQGVEFDILAQSTYPEWHGTSADWAPTFAALAESYPALGFAIVEYSQEKRAVNDIMFDLPNEQGRGTFIWEPTRWGETLFDQDGDRRIANQWLREYDEMALDYGLR
jgi:arabinogalactan endo-1,4-beta-galactosidase